MKYFLISEQEAIRVKNNLSDDAKYYVWNFLSQEATPDLIAKLNLIPKKERKPFAVGDRAILYHEKYTIKGRIEYIRGTVVCVEDDNAKYAYAHIKQIRRLIPKPKPKAVRVTRGQLAKLWDDSSTIPAEECPNFDRHCKDLGL